MEIDKSRFCNLCFSESVLFQLHIFQNEALKGILNSAVTGSEIKLINSPQINKQDQFNLCYLCKSMAQHAESFVQNVQYNQLILANYQNLTELTLQTLKKQMQSPWCLSQFSYEPIEIGLGSNENCEGKFITYSSKKYGKCVNGYKIDVIEELRIDENAKSELVDEDLSDNDDGKINVIKDALNIDDDNVESELDGEDLSDNDNGKIGVIKEALNIGDDNAKSELDDEDLSDNDYGKIDVIKEELFSDDNAESQSVDKVFSDNDNDLEQYIKQEQEEEEDEYPLQLLKDQLESQGIRIKCGRTSEGELRVKRKQIPRSIKKNKDSTCNLNLKNKSNIEEINIHVIHITQEECMEERLKMASDPKYLNSIYKCQNCIKGFMVKKCYDRHMETHSVSNGDVICEICRQTMSSKYKLMKHNRYHLVRFKCSKCGLERHSRLAAMNHHKAFHGKEIYMYKCTQCGKAFKRQVSLRRHVAYAHKPKKQRQQCAYCEKNFGTKETLKSHIIVTHPEQVSEGKMPKRYACEECGMEFSAPCQVRYHSVKHSQDKKYCCVECDKRFKSRIGLHYHLKTSSAHADYANFNLSCPHCDKRFALGRSLKTHINRIHLKIKPYQCDQCSKAYISSWSLKEHKKLVHEGYKRPRKFPCTMCDNMFARRQTLIHHLRTHTGEKPFLCTKCPAQFAQRGVLDSHVRSVHLRLTKNGRPK